MRETVRDWLGLVHELYPPAQAASWDHVGLQVGDPDAEVARVLVALDVTSAVVTEAAEEPDTLVLAHHPLLFRPLAALTPDTASGRTALSAARHGVAVAAAHTNLDVAQDGAGTSDPVAACLGLTQTRPLTTELREGGRCKLATFVPPEAVEPVVDAMAAAGAGTIGEYERCSFRVRGTGTFRPGEHADPYSGEIGVDAAEDEYRVEMEVPRSRVGAVVAALHEAHPYDEAAYDLLPMIEGAEVGFGRIGRLPAPMPLRMVAEQVREELPAPHLRFAGDPQRPIETVACVGGAGDSMIPAAIAAGADALVTGDLRHHVTLDALEQGLAVIDAGHHATEVAALPSWRQRLEAGARRRGLSSPVIASQVATGPWR